MRIKGAQMYIAMVCLILGIMFTVQYKTTSYYKASLVPPKVEDLTAQLKTLTDQRDAAQQKVASLNQQLEDIRNSDKEMALLQKELQQANLVGGLFPVEGQGITITLADNPLTLQPGDTTSTFALSAVELLAVVNDLKASMAEAIVINGQRITALSEIRWEGSMIAVNGNRISPPYKIEVIGNPDTLESGMNMPGSYLNILKFGGTQVDMKRVDKIVLPAFNGSSKMTYGKPVK